MLLAVVQCRADLPSVESQTILLRALRPDHFYISWGMTASSAQRLLERLESLRAGDRVAVAHFSSIAGSLADGVAILDGLLRRGVEIQVLDGDGTLVSVTPTNSAGRMLRALTEVGGGAWRPKRKANILPELLGENDITEIRRLYAAGLSPRKIGLIFRRTPKAINDLVCGDDRVATSNAPTSPDVEPCQVCDPRARYTRSLPWSSR